MPAFFSGTAPVSQKALWFGLLGGAVAWTLHLLAVYAVAEWGCVMTAPRPGLRGESPVVLMIVVSVACLLLAGAAAAVAYGSLRRVRGSSGERSGVQAFMAYTGLISNGLFAFVIVSQAVPIFYFVSAC